MARWLVVRSLTVLTLLLGVAVVGTADDSKTDVAIAIQGTPKIDGKIDDAWKKAPAVHVNKPISDLLTIEPKDIATAAVQFMYDKDHLYALWIVKDSALSADAIDDWAQDSVELFLDQNQNRTNVYEDDDAQYRVNYEGKLSGQGAGYDESDLQAAVAKTDIGYIVEMAIRVNKAELKPGAKLGLELQVNDDHDSGTRDAIAKWHHTEDDSWEDTSNFGTLELK